MPRLLLISALLCVPLALLAHDGEAQIEAKAAYVQDLTDGKIIFAKNPEAQLPLASLTKLMTVFTAKRYGLVQQSIVSNEEICFTLVTSSNKDADRIGSHLGADPTGYMNQVAKELGMAQTFYLNTSGLDISENLAGAYGSARDVTALLSVFYDDFPFLLACTTESKASLNGPAIANTNVSISKTIGIIGSKTGFTDLAGGNLAVIVDVGINHPIAIVVLGSTQEGRFSDVETLVSYAIDTLADAQ